jgi:N-acetyl-anhydromuramyl-L-alanine amidase AmpD
MRITNRQTPNISRSISIKPEGIILHHTGGSYTGAVSWCLNTTSQVSYHCIVDTNGDRTILAQDNQRAWHAGRSTFKGKSDCNSFMLGVAVSGDTGSRKMTDQEIESVARWCIDKMNLHKFGIDMITTHAIVSPGRKNDVSQIAERQIKSKIQEILNSSENKEEKFYIVKAGDTLSKIARENKTTVEKIKRDNNLKSTVVQINQRLKL